MLKQRGFLFFVAQTDTEKPKSFNNLYISLKASTLQSQLKNTSIPALDPEETMRTYQNTAFIIIALLYASVSFGQSEYADFEPTEVQASEVNTVLTNKNCSGQNIYDFECNENIINRIATQKNVTQGIQILIDTRDTETCKELETFLSDKAQKNKFSLNSSDLCAQNSSADRYKQVTLMWESKEEYLTELKLDFFKNNAKTLGNDTRNLSVMMAATVGLLWVGPESISKWDKKEIRRVGLFHKWNQNFHSRPVLDQDDPFINYVGHPISGSIYYNIARTQGYNPLQSFGYSVLMSTFFWEYGFEAIAEKPSLQDLFITPIVGSLIGEVFYQWSLKIEANDGKLFNSKGLGKVVLFLINPAGKISDSINHLLGHKVIQEAKGNIVLSRKKINSIGGDIWSNYIGIRLDFFY